MRMRLGAVTLQVARSLELRRLSYALLLTLITVALSAQVAPGLSDLPSSPQVIAFLTESIDWYRHCALERRVGTEPVDLVFLEDSRGSAAQIVQLSFEFARADAQFAQTPEASDGKTRSAIASSSPDLAHFLQLEKHAELQKTQASYEIELLKNKINTTRAAERRKLEAALDATQSRLDVLQAGLATLQQTIEFVRAFTTRDTGDLLSTVDDLARTIPDVTSPSTAASQAQNPPANLSAKPGDSGILALSSEVSALARKLNILDDAIRRTENLRQVSDQLRSPLLAAINKRLPAVAENALGATDLADLQRQKASLDELSTVLKTLSPAIVALDKQGVLLAAYTAHLKSWRAAVIAQNEKTWKNLISRLLGAAAVIAGLVLIGAVVRRVTRHHMGDTESRHIVLVTERVVLWATIVGVAAFAFASDLASLATFFGLVAAGVAVALQSVIVSAVSYFVLVGRRGIRIGDRVQISGVSGEVTDIGWLQFQLKEIDTRTQQPAGNVVTFSNSIVLASPSTGISKLNRHGYRPAQLEVTKTASPSKTDMCLSENEWQNRSKAPTS